MRPAVTPATLVGRRIRVLRRNLPGALAGQATDLHRARVASRRLREILPLVAGIPGKTKRRVRRLTRVLGRVRELDVTLQLLESDPFISDAPQLAVFTAREHVRGRREQRRQRMLQKLRDINLKKLDRGLDEIASLAREENTGWRRTLVTQLTRRAKRMREAVTEAGAIYLPDRLHAVRLAAKKLRYALELGAEAGVRRAAALAVIVQRTQERLGHLQDRAVLLREVLATADASQDEAVRQGLTMLGAEVERSARELHGQYVAHRDELLDVVSEIQHQVLPELAHVGQQRMLRAALSSRRRGTAKGRRRDRMVG
jgi:CHAD domain-containing protein